MIFLYSLERDVGEIRIMSVEERLHFLNELWIELFKKSEV